MVIPPFLATAKNGGITLSILLLGKNGQVGRELQRTLLPLGEVIALGRRDADLESLPALDDLLDAHSPDIIVNAAAYTAVDKAEGDAVTAHRINAKAVGVMASHATELGEDEGFSNPFNFMEARMNTHKNARLTSVSHDEPSLNITVAKNKVLNKGRTPLFESDLVDTVKRNVAARTNTHALLIVLEGEEFQGPDFAAVKAMLKRPVIFDGRNLYETAASTNCGFNMSPSAGKFKRTLCAV